MNLVKLITKCSSNKFYFHKIFDTKNLEKNNFDS